MALRVGSNVYKKFKGFRTWKGYIKERISGGKALVKWEKRDGWEAVIFSHPGTEATSYPYGFYPESVFSSPSTPYYKPPLWRNSFAKRRLYMRVSGSTLDSSSHITSSENFYVWGEWTGPAKLYYIEDSKPKKLNVLSEPNCIVEPYADFSRNQFVDLQMSDVDPWIFSVFNYTLCKQANLEFMSKLVSGDVIYFGTGTNDEMVLDTVFVVGEFLDTDDMTEEKYRDYLGGKRLLDVGEETMSKEWKEFCERKSPHTGEYLKQTPTGYKYPVASRI
ncbi:hypothetical protein TrVE_jg7844 [Triparma verrucosa]|uniref:Uncharacterized protein n=1 Tax=Triparma verrucosa TaxID=1606542 RepID=A0A9W7C365_9STRA|nr:hypothetical protein TrVE_jg7844 [Triparma verrucosa]